MKKIFIALIVSITLLSCKKDKGDCYQCYNVNGTDAGIFCHSDGHETDSNGNALNCNQIH